MSSFRHLAETMGKRAAVWILVVLVLAGAVRVHRAWSAPATSALTAEVLAALDKGDAPRAASLADVALRQEGVSVSERACLLFYRGLARELLGATDGALKDFTQALGGQALPSGEREQALLQRGFLRDGLGRLDEATGDYTSAIALKGPSFATALNNRANIYRRQNKLAAAQRDYMAALSAEGGKPQYAYYGLGRIAEARHDARTARAFYAKAVLAAPDYSAASERLAALGGPPEMAIPDREERIVLHPPPPGKAADGVETRQGRAVALRALPDGKDRSPPAPQARAAGTAGLMRAAPVRQLMLRPALDAAGARASGGTQIQLGAWRSAAQADAGWQEARARAEGALDGLSPHVLVADLPEKGRYFRLRVSLEAGRSGAEFCAGLTAKGIACIPVRP